MGKTNNLKAVDFFCSGGGMSYGMQQVDIRILAGIDIDKSCEATYKANIKNAEFIHTDILHLREEVLEKKLALKKNDNDLIFIGCSPCQFWSVINTDRRKAEKSKYLLREFLRFVKYFYPGYVVVENVPGILRKKEQSGLQKFMDWLNNNGYAVHYDIYNMSDYGVPQNRKRFTLLANRITDTKIMPLKSHGQKLTVRDVLGEENGFYRIPAGYKDATGFLHTVPNLEPVNLARLKKIKKDGGNRLGFANNPALQLPCFRGRDNAFKDTFGRLWWDRPSPTITTKFFSISNGRFVHPDEDRSLSIREGATLQSFPKNYKFYGSSVSALARMIGNAVPPKYAESIGKTIIQNHIKI